MTKDKGPATYNDLPPKLQGLTHQPFNNKLKAMILNHASLNELKDFCAVHGFKISLTYLGKYRTYILQNNTKDTYVADHLVKTKLGNYAFTNPELTQEDKLKKDTDFLDDVIQLGTKQFKESDLVEVDVDMVFKAIDLKNKITGGANYNLTNYGIKHLTDLTEAKYSIAIQILLSYIPDYQKKEAIQAMEEAEDDFYSKTEYYEDFLKAKGLSPQEIKVKLHANQTNSSDKWRR